MANDARVRARLIVLDTGPLITLAAADSLDYLLYPGAPLYIPDAVLYEATQDSQRIGAAEILDWAQRNSEQVHPVSILPSGRGSRTLRKSAGSARGSARDLARGRRSAAAGARRSKAAEIISDFFRIRQQAARRQADTAAPS